MNLRQVKGQSLIEFALVLPLLLLILLGIMDFSLVMYNQAVITNAAREGARAGIVARTPRRTVSEIQGIADGYCTSHVVSFATSTPSTVVVGYLANPSSTDELTVSVTYLYTWILPVSFLSPRGSGTLSLSSTAVMRYE